LGDLSAHFSRAEFRCHDDHGNPCPYCGGKIERVGT
jgi:formamidopyrimidine-DNA glycosylase